MHSSGWSSLLVKCWPLSYIKVMSDEVKLDITQLVEIEGTLVTSQFPNTRWISLGLKLGLHKTTLDDIKAENKEDLRKCVLECLTMWLREADDVKNKGVPTWLTLICALKDVEETSVAESIERQRANVILQQIRISLSESLTDAVYISFLMCKEGLFTDRAVANIQGRLSVSDKNRALLSSVEDSISKNHRSLEIFGRVIDKVNGNGPLAKKVLFEFKKVFVDESKLMERFKVIDGDTVEDTTAETPIDFGVVSLPASKSTEFRYIRAKFANTFLRVKYIIENSQVPLDRLKRFVQFSSSDLGSQLTSSNSAKDLLYLILDRCSLIDIKHIDEMVEEFDLKIAKQYIKKYKEELDEFCQKTSVRLCLKESFEVTLPYTPIICESSTLIIEGSPDEYTLQDVRDVLYIAFERLSYAIKMVYIEEGPFPNSIAITCTLAMHLAMLLLAKGFDNLEKLKPKRLIRLNVGYVTVWDRDHVDEEIKQLQDRIATLKEELDLFITEKESDEEMRAIRISLVEKQKELDELKQTLSEKEEYIQSLLNDDEETLKEKLETNEKLQKSMQMEIEKLNSILKSKEETEVDLYVSKEEIDALQDKVTRLSIELRDYKDRNEKLTKDIEDLQSRLKEREEEIPDTTPTS